MKSSPLRTLVPLVLAVLLAACSQQSTTFKVHEIPPELAKSSTVSVSLPGFIVDENTVLRWYSDLVWVDDSGNAMMDTRGPQLQAALQSEFERKGFRFVSAGQSADYDVLAVALVGEGSGMEALKDVFKLYPSLATDSSKYDKGTVMLVIAPAGTKNLVWRGALKVFVTNEALDPAVVQARLNWAALRLLESIPLPR